MLILGAGCETAPVVYESQILIFRWKKHQEQIYPQDPLKFSWLLGRVEYFSGWFGKPQPESLKVKGKLDTSEKQNVERQLFPIP